MLKWVEEKRKDELISTTTKAGKFKISVHRHIRYRPDAWLMDCYPLFDNKELASKEL